MGCRQFTIRQELKKLNEEGVLHCVPRVGTFAGAPSARGSEFYLLLLRDGHANSARLPLTQAGFEEAIARRGDAVLMLEKSAAAELYERGALPPLAGVYDLAYWPGEPSLELVGLENAARVCVGKRFETRPGYDLVSFDDVEGGRIATRASVKARTPQHRVFGDSRVAGRIEFDGLVGRSAKAVGARRCKKHNSAPRVWRFIPPKTRWSWRFLP